jgi:cell division protein FtsN
MATKDYVKRKPRPKSPKNTSQRNAQSAPSSIAWWRVILAFLILLGFAGGLYWLSQQPATDTLPATEQPAVTPASKPVKPVSDNDDPLPELPEEEWEFIKILPGYEVQVDAEAIESDKLYLMQCGSFKTFTQADRLRANMALAGLEPQIRGSQNGWYRVILGPYESKRDAERDRHSLQRVQVNGCQIWFWNLD